jgi:hypothetical protein
MKNRLLPAIPAFLLCGIVLIGCKSSDTSTNSYTESTKLGSLEIRLIRDDKPSSVSSIVVRMFREGQTTLSGSLPVSMDSLLTYSFSRVPVGKWDLLVNAMNGGGSLLYSGQRQVLIQENATSIWNMSFSLAPPSIQLTLDWGSHPTDWIDFANNPILRKSQSDNFSDGIMIPQLLLQNGQYKMWFTYYGQTQNVSQWIGYATSYDGIEWTQPQPVDLTLGSIGTWDSKSMTVGPIILTNNQYFMFYQGSNGNKIQIGLATSINGVNWIKQANPVIVPNAPWESSHIGATDIIKIGDIYSLYYHGVDASGNTTINLATSPDGFTWTKCSTNPILRATQSWELSGGIYFPSIIDDNGIFKMLYSSRTPNNEGFGIATSFDGIAWTKESLTPFFSVQTSQSRWANSIGYPCWRKFGNEYHIYYSGISRNIGAFGSYAIGLLRKK